LKYPVQTYCTESTPPNDVLLIFFPLLFINPKSPTIGTIDLYISYPNPYLQLLVFYPAKHKKVPEKLIIFYQRKSIVSNVLYCLLVYQIIAVLSKRIH